MKISEINRHAAWPAVIAAGGAVAGGAIAAIGAGSASKAQQKAAKDAAEIQLQMFGQSREDLAPWREGGAEAINHLRRMLGLSYYRPVETPEGTTPAGTTVEQPVAQAPPINQLATMRRQQPSVTIKDQFGNLRQVSLSNLPGPQQVEYLTGIPSGMNRAAQIVSRPATSATAQPAALADTGFKLVPGTGEMLMPEFEESPGYQFTLKEGKRAIQNALSAMGANRSGRHLRAATEHAEGLASTEYDNFLNRWYRSLNPYFSLAGQGQVATQATGQMGAGAAAGASQAGIYAGDARAAGAINQANALTGAITGGANQLLYYNALRNLPQQQSYNLLSSPQQYRNVGYQAPYGTFGR